MAALGLRGQHLIALALEWSDITLMSAQVRGDGYDAVRAAFRSIHTFALAMRHVFECLQKVQAFSPVADWPADVRGPWRRFERAFESEGCRTLRDLLEHEEEYVAGGGLKRAKLGPTFNSDLTLGFSWGERLTKVHFMGLNFSLDEPLEATGELIGPLLRWFEAESGDAWGGQLSLIARSYALPEGKTTGMAADGDGTVQVV